MEAKIEAQALALAQSAAGMQKRLLLACVRALALRFLKHPERVTTGHRPQ